MTFLDWWQYADKVEKRFFNKTSHLVFPKNTVTYWLPRRNQWNAQQTEHFNVFCSHETIYLRVLLYGSRYMFLPRLHVHVSCNSMFFSVYTPHMVSSLTRRTNPFIYLSMSTCIRGDVNRTITTSIFNCIPTFLRFIFKVYRVEFDRGGLMVSPLKIGFIHGWPFVLNRDPLVDISISISTYRVENGFRIIDRHVDKDYALSVRISII